MRTNPGKLKEEIIRMRENQEARAKNSFGRLQQRKMYRHQALEVRKMTGEEEGKSRRSSNELTPFHFGPERQCMELEGSAWGFSLEFLERGRRFGIPVKCYFGARSLGPAVRRVQGAMLMPELLHQVLV